MQREDDFFHSPGTALWFGVCESRDDPAKMGRIRVRIFGFHSPDRTEIPTETLPWASIMLPTTSSGMSGIMSTASGIIEGTWVIGFFRDGPSSQDPVVIGVLMGMSAPRWSGISGSAKPEEVEQAASQLVPGPAVLDPKQKMLDTLTQEKSTEIFDKLKTIWEESIISKAYTGLISKFPELKTKNKETVKDAIRITKESDPSTISEIKKVTPVVATDTQGLGPESITTLKQLTPAQKEILKGQIR